MKRIITFLILVIGTIGFSQQKTTSTVDLLSNLYASLTLNNSNSTATLTISGPSDRWFAIAFGNFGNPGAMNFGNDLVYYNGSTLQDATHNGQGNPPSNDAVNNWTVVSNTPSAGTRTIVATRPFIAEASDYTFNYSNGAISIAGAHGATASYLLANHETNRYNAGSVAFTSLGVDDFTLNSAQIYPNPSKGEFVIITKTNLEKINIYSQTGAFIKTIDVKEDNDNKSVEINIDKMQTGVYLIQLVNETDKIWKKIVVTN